MRLGFFYVALNHEYYIRSGRSERVFGMEANPWIASSADDGEIAHS